MNRKLKTVLCAALVLLLMFSCCCVSFADEPMPVTVKAKAAVLMDVDSGKVLMSMNADEKLYPASVTKIMTLLLVTEALMRRGWREEEILAVLGGNLQRFLRSGLGAAALA